jgi:hypothetical protein
VLAKAAQLDAVKLEVLKAVKDLVKIDLFLLVENICPGSDADLLAHDENSLTRER